MESAWWSLAFPTNMTPRDRFHQHFWRKANGKKQMMKSAQLPAIRRKKFELCAQKIFEAFLASFL